MKKQVWKELHASGASGPASWNEKDEQFVLPSSKWGEYPLCRHSRTYCPYNEPNYRVKYYARYVRTIQNQTFSNGEDVKYASEGSLTIGNTAIEDGAVARFTSDEGVVIQPGFEVEDGGKLIIETW